jgi:hypothetical protein
MAENLGNFAMRAVVIVSTNQDFTDVAASLINKELGVDVQVVASKAQLPEWPEPVVITDENLPVRMQDVLRRIRSVQHKAEESIRIGAWELSIRSKTLSGGGAQVDLTDKEAQLLQCLFEAETAGIEREELLRRVWGFASDINTHTLETHIYRLRSKLRELSEENDLISVSGGIYKLEV